MKYIERQNYLERLKRLRNTPDIKIITGLRRAGKSELIKAYMDWIIANESNANIIYIDFADLKYDDLKSYKMLNDHCEKLYNADELTWQTVKLKHRIGLMNLLDWNHMFYKASGYIPSIIENETLDADEWIELVETVKDLNVEDDVVKDYFYDKLDEDLKSEISRFSDQSECDEEVKKVESLKELLPKWKWYDVFGEIDEAEKRIKLEEENDEDYDGEYERWRSQSEKEDAEIDEMFSALRNNS